MWSYLSCTAERLGFTLSYSNTVTLSKRINDVKTKIVSCIAIALARVAQPNNHIHRCTIISQRLSRPVTEHKTLSLTAA